MEKRRFFVTGSVSSVFGVRGQVKVRPASADGAHILSLARVILADGEDAARGKSYIIEGSSLAGTRGAQCVLMKFAGVDTPEAARLLVGKNLVVSREEAAPCAPGEYYIEDLKGLRVTSPAGDCLGEIQDIIEGGGGFLAEVMINDGKKMLVPFRDAFFGAVNLEKGEIVLHAEWILEENT